MRTYNELRYDLVNYYSLIDVYTTFIGPTEVLPYTYDVEQGGTTAIDLNSFLSELEIINDSIIQVSDITSTDLAAGGLCDKLWKEVYNRYYNHAIIKLRSDADDATVHKEMLKWFGRFINNLVYTFPKYKQMFDAYATQKSHLLDKIQKSTSITGSNTGTVSNSSSSSNVNKNKFNDTPQELGDFTPDTYMSEYREITDQGQAASTVTNNLANSATSTESWDAVYLIEKLELIENKYSLLMKKWVNEFEKLFMEVEVDEF